MNSREQRPMLTSSSDSDDFQFGNFLEIAIFLDKVTKIITGKFSNSSSQSPSYCLVYSTLAIESATTDTAASDLTELPAASIGSSLLGVMFPLALPPVEALEADEALEDELADDPVAADDDVAEPEPVALPVDGLALLVPAAEL